MENIEEEKEEDDQSGDGNGGNSGYRIVDLPNDLYDYNDISEYPIITIPLETCTLDITVTDKDRKMKPIWKGHYNFDKHFGYYFQFVELKLYTSNTKSKEDRLIIENSIACISYPKYIIYLSLIITTTPNNLTLLGVNYKISHNSDNNFVKLKYFAIDIIINSLSLKDGTKDKFICNMNKGYYKYVMEINTISRYDLKELIINSNNKQSAFIEHPIYYIQEYKREIDLVNKNNNNNAYEYDKDEDVEDAIYIDKNTNSYLILSNKYSHFEKIIDPNKHFDYLIINNKEIIGTVGPLKTELNISVKFIEPKNYIVYMKITTKTKSGGSCYFTILLSSAYEYNHFKIN